ncbi:MAG: pentapeptide repeat-containing protein [Alphaproteobacteria bacterium]|nr:pentapeptide repeat-containing protein [Alphaproteobacteria bacterium]
MSDLNTRLRGIALAAALLVSVTASGASAQQAQPRIWDIPFGTHVDDLPQDEFVDPACGTNGGPAGFAIGSFTQFERCPEEASGLREVWFIFDDTQEYMARAWRDAGLVTRFSAMSLMGQPLILSFLFNRDGRVQGYRIFTDTRADPAVRIEAYMVSLPLKARFLAGGGECLELPRADGETKIEGSPFIKELCRGESAATRVTIETRLYYRTGQQNVGQFGGKTTANEFDSFSRLEVLYVGPLPDLPPAARAAARRDQAAFAGPREAFLAGATRECPGCDLANADLRRRDLSGADLRGANLAGAVLHRAVLRRANLEGANLQGANLNLADLTLATLRGAHLYDAMLFQADGGRADFSGADLGHALIGKAHLSIANFEGANLESADLGEARMNDTKLTNATLNGTYLRLAVLFRADMRGVFAEGASLIEASLRDADLSGAVFRDADLRTADLAGADLSRADFTGARLLSAILLNTNQAGTIFTGALMPDNTIAP